MSQILRPFLDLTDTVFSLARRDLPGLWVKMGTSLNDVETNLPYLYGTVLGGSAGGSGGRTERVTTLDLETFAETYAQALSRSEELSAYLCGYPRSVMVGERLVVLDEVVETRPPVELPWDDSQIRRFAATYLISARR